MKFVVACTQRTAADQHARALANHGLLRQYFVGTRKPTVGIPAKLTSLNPLWGAAATASSIVFPGYPGEWIRAGMHPWYDSWVTRQIKPDDNIISSYGYANFAFKKVKNNGGATMIEAGNSHPAYFWEVVSDEHKIWGVDRPPYPTHWNQRARAMLEFTDYIICPSRYVENSYLDRGWPSEKLLYAPYPTDLSLFRPDEDNIPPADPLWVICSGGVCLRKGFPYLLEAMRIIRKERDARLMLTGAPDEAMKPVFKRYNDIPIDWSPSLGHQDLAKRLRKAHVFALLSLEDGFARTVTEAIACGVPVVVTPNTGAMDFVVKGKNGYIVPIRDATAAAEAIVKALDIRLKGMQDEELPDLSFNAFENRFLSELKRVGLLRETP